MCWRENLLRGYEDECPDIKIAVGQPRGLGVPSTKAKAAFVEPMLLLPKSSLPEGPAWAYELKLDGYRAIGLKADGRTQLRSRNNKDFNRRYPGIVGALAGVAEDTVIDGEVVALDDSGRPSFNALQNAGSAEAPIFYYVFDVLVLAGHDVMTEPLHTRRKMY